MAMTREEVDTIVKRIAETGGFTDEMMEDVKKLKDELDEREGLLASYSEGMKEDWKSKFEEADRVRADFERKYLDMRDRYVNRFFNGSDEPVQNVSRETMVTEDEEIEDESDYRLDDMFKGDED